LLDDVLFGGSECERSKTGMRLVINVVLRKSVGGEGGGRESALKGKKSRERSDMGGEKGFPRK